MNVTLSILVEQNMVSLVIAKDNGHLTLNSFPFHDRNDFAAAMDKAKQYMRAMEVFTEGKPITLDPIPFEFTTR